MVKIYEFQEHALKISGEKDDLLALAECLRDAEGTLGDLRYQIEYAFDVDGVRTCDLENSGCDDEDYADNYLQGAFSSAKESAADTAWDIAPAESPRNFAGEHRIHDDYVISAIPNAFNDKTSWWISKHGCTAAMYCFSASGSERNQKKEAEYQLQHIDSYIQAFESRFLGKEA